MATSAPAAPAAAPARRGPSLVKVLIGAVAAIVLAGAGGGAWYVLGRPAAAQQEAAGPAPESAAPIFVKVAPLTVNLQAQDDARFLHLGMTLRVRDERSRELVTGYMPELRSRALLLLSNRNPETLVTPEDRTRLAEELHAGLDRPLGENLPAPGIDGVTFDTFVVQ